MSGVRTFEITDEAFATALAHKATVHVSVCIPCRNEAATIGSIVGQIRRVLVEVERPWVDELLVFDDGSADATTSVAREAGASVVSVNDVLPEAGRSAGKGNVLWCSVAASTGDVIVWCDGDLLSFTPSYVQRLLVPLLLDPSIAFVKGFYERPLDAAGEGGGRNTELVARPMLRLLFPELADVRQPLGGEYALRRSFAEMVAFAQGYGVEIGLLIDAFRSEGANAIVQVDLGVRRHRHRPLRELSLQATEILHAMLVRAGVDGERLGHTAHVRVNERPPLVTVASYRAGSRDGRPAQH